MDPKIWQSLKKRNLEGNDLIIAVAQDSKTKDVLMVAFMDKEAFEKTASTGEAYYYSTSRKQIWKKGEKSGNVQKVKDMRIDCDCDALLLVVDQKGGACHEGYKSCFFKDIEGNIKDKKVFDPEEAYK
jgi:phosphoribosyl-AMP cyclohydrolase